MAFWRSKTLHPAGNNFTRLSAGSRKTSIFSIFQFSEKIIKPLMSCRDVKRVDNLLLGISFAFLQKKLPNLPEMIILHEVILAQAQLHLVYRLVL